MPGLLIGLIKDQNLVLAFCVIVAAITASLVRSRWSEALKNAGPDRDRLIRSLRLGGDVRRH